MPRSTLPSSTLGLIMYNELPDLFIDKAESPRGDLLTYMDAHYRTMDDIYDIIRDTDDGPGFSKLLDVDRTIDSYDALAWLGQFVGARFRKGSTTISMREDLRAGFNLRRGSPDALIHEVSKVLTGNKVVIIQERYTSAYNFRVSVLQSEAPDETVVRAAVARQKPIGVSYELVFLTGVDYDTLATNSADYDDVFNTFPTYADLLNNPAL